MSGHESNSRLTYVISVLIVICFAGLMAWVFSPPQKKKGSVNDQRQGHQQVGQGGQGAAGAGRLRPARRTVRRLEGRRQVLPRQKVAQAADSRVSFVAHMARRFARRYAVKISATGPNRAVFLMAWPADMSKTDREHMEQLKRAAPLHEEARGRGFRRARMQVGKKVVWTKKL